MTGGAASAAQAAKLDDPTFAFDTPTQSIEYGEYFSFSATAHNAPGPSFWKAVDGSITGAPAGFEVYWGSYKVDEQTVAAYLDSPEVLPPGTYSVSITLGDQEGAGAQRVTTSPGTLTVVPAPLIVALAVGADPSNPVNAIVSAQLTGAYFSTGEGVGRGGQSPAGTWDIVVVDQNGEIVHEFSQPREAGSVVTGVSTYWPDVPPGEYTVRGSFTPSGASVTNFSITQAQPATYAPAPAPGATSTASPAPPAPEPTGSVGLTLPGWIPIVAGVLSAGLLAMLIVQIVRITRLRRRSIDSGVEA